MPYVAHDFTATVTWRITADGDGYYVETTMNNTYVGAPRHCRSARDADHIVTYENAAFKAAIKQTLLDATKHGWDGRNG